MIVAFVALIVLTDAVPLTARLLKVPTCVIPACVPALSESLNVPAVIVPATARLLKVPTLVILGCAAVVSVPPKVVPVIPPEATTDDGVIAPRPIEIEGVVVGLVTVADTPFAVITDTELNHSAY